MRWDAPQPFAVIGRDPSMDLCLDHPEIDRYHAYLQVIEGQVYGLDLGSQSGTRWQDGSSQSGWLDPSRGIGIGPYVLRLAADDREAPASSQWAADPPDPLASRPLEDDDLPRVILEFRRDGAKPIRWRMRHMLTLVGTSTLCKILLTAPGVSPFHCSLVRTKMGLWVVNLIGQEGVIVNGANIRAARLEEGDELRIGEISIRVLFDTPEAMNGEARPLIGEARGRETSLVRPTSTSNELATGPSQATWMNPGREVGKLLAERVKNEGDLPAPLLAMVLDQFGQMQQQFLDQFQQTTMMMFRVLGTMHRDQMDELREKLDSLHQIGENLQGFQAQLSNTVAPEPGRIDPWKGGRTPHDPMLSALPGGNPAGRGRTAPSPGEKARRPPPSPEHEAGPPRSKFPALADDPSMPSQNVHEWLIGRIAALEDEQRTRWQKILDLVRGK